MNEPRPIAVDDQVLWMGNEGRVVATTQRQCKVLFPNVSGMFFSHSEIEWVDRKDLELVTR